MNSTVSFNGQTFPPSFGYLEAMGVCSDINNENPTWNVVLQFDSNSNFSFSSFNATYEELWAATEKKLKPLSGPPQISAFAFTQNADILLATAQEKFLPHEASHIIQH